MKLFLGLIILISIILLGIYTAKAFKIKHKMAPLVRKILLFGFIIMVFNLMSLVTENPFLCRIAYGGYFMTSDWLLYCLLQFSIEFIGSDFDKHVKRKYMILLLCVDSASVILNILTEHMFELHEVILFQTEHYYELDVKPLFFIHYTIIMMLAVFSLISLVYRTVKSPAFYKRKYMIIAGIMSVIVLLNMISVTSAIDISIIGYVLEGICIYYCVFVYTPQKLLSKTLLNVSQDMNVGLYVIDIDGNSIYSNKFADDLLGLNNLLINRNGMNVKEWCRDYYMNDADKLIKEETFYKGSDEVVLKVQLQKMMDSKNALQGGYFVIQDKTDEINSLRKEKHKSTHDSLTGLYNKSFFCEKSEEYIRKHPDIELLVICTDIKDFKMINDFMGMKTGDTVLTNFAKMLQKKICGAITIGRLTNDIFAILMLKDDYNEKLFAYAEREEFFAGVEIKATLPIVTYIGVYEVIERNLPVSVMCDRARMAISTIKGDYNKRIAYYNNKLRDNALYEQELISNLNTAIADKQLKMFLQPQTASDGTLLGAEALVRWIHPEKGPIMPGDFIPVFERNGLISYVDMYIWETACKYLRKWKKEGRESLYISVNISPRDFYFLDIYEIFTELIKKYNISTKNLKLEITETAMVMDFKRQLDLINKLRKEGFIVEMDDFGSGYSSLNMLKDIQVDVLKIDMEFLKKAEDEERSKKILEMIINLSKNLQMPVITEGVETEEQVRFLADMGCEMFQGYYFARPMAVEDFEQKYLKKS